MTNSTPARDRAQEGGGKGLGTADRPVANDGRRAKVAGSPDGRGVANPAIIGSAKQIELGAKSPGSMTPDEMRAKCAGFEAEFNKWVLGYPHIGRALLISLLMPGRVRHTYALGMPGLAKSHSMETVARIVPGLIFQRIQCHSELTPSQIVGGPVFDQETRKMKIIEGDIIGKHLVLADELPRATPNAQGGFLQAMAEGAVSLPGLLQPIKMQDPFVLLATANPAEQKGVYPLPEAQWDRFLFQLYFKYVEEKYAKMMLMRPELTDGSSYAMMTGQMTLPELLQIRDYIKGMHVSQAFIDYLYAVVDCTRPGQKYHEKLVREFPDTANVMGMIKRGDEWGGGAGPRAEQCLVMAAKIYAFLYGVDAFKKPRDYVTPSDLETLLNAVLRARIIMNPEAKWPTFQDRAVTPDQVIDVIRDKIKPVNDPNAYKRK